MTVKDAVRYISLMDCGKRPVKLIDSSRLKHNVLVVITEDTAPAGSILDREFTTRRLSVFVNGERQVGTILDTKSG